MKIDSIASGLKMMSTQLDDELRLEDVTLRYIFYLHSQLFQAARSGLVSLRHSISFSPIRSCRKFHKEQLGMTLA